MIASSSVPSGIEPTGAPELPTQWPPSCQLPLPPVQVYVYADADGTRRSDPARAPSTTRERMRPIVSKLTGMRRPALVMGGGGVIAVLAAVVAWAAAGSLTFLGATSVDGLGG